MKMCYILTEEELDALGEAVNTLNNIYRSAPISSEVESDSFKVMDILDNFIDKYGEPN